MSTGHDARGALVQQDPHNHDLLWVVRYMGAKAIENPIVRVILPGTYWLSPEDCDW